MQMKIRFQVPFRKLRSLPSPQGSVAGDAGVLCLGLGEAAKIPDYGGFLPSVDNYWRAQHARQGRSPESERTTTKSWQQAASSLEHDA
jgi:hypothetical protein